MVADKLDVVSIRFVFLGARVGGDGVADYSARQWLPTASRKRMRGRASWIFRSRWLSALVANRLNSGRAPLRPARRAHRRLAAGEPERASWGRGSIANIEPHP